MTLQIPPANEPHPDEGRILAASLGWEWLSPERAEAAFL